MYAPVHHIEAANPTTRETSVVRSCVSGATFSSVVQTFWPGVNCWVGTTWTPAPPPNIRYGETQSDILTLTLFVPFKDRSRMIDVWDTTSVVASPLRIETN